MDYCNGYYCRTGSCFTGCVYVPGDRKVTLHCVGGADIVRPCCLAKSVEAKLSVWARLLFVWRTYEGREAIRLWKLYCWLVRHLISCERHFVIQEVVWGNSLSWWDEQRSASRVVTVSSVMLLWLLRWQQLSSGDYHWIFRRRTRTFLLKIPTTAVLCSLWNADSTRAEVTFSSLSYSVVVYIRTWCIVGVSCIFIKV